MIVLALVAIVPVVAYGAVCLALIALYAAACVAAGTFFLLAFVVSIPVRLVDWYRDRARDRAVRLRIARLRARYGTAA